ncbi:MAG: serine/threonine protein kinase [Deltaproteobacteria bacterium]|nr:serine/threonine protein kinase [Deltaproteobacteria bacterium]
MARLGDIEVEALIGRGGMAEVYRGRYVAGPRTGWPVAIKRLNAAHSAEPLAVQLFLSEGELAKQLRHPHIVEVYETGAVSGASYIVMELVEGSDLSQIIRRANELNLDLPVDFCCLLAASSADGLHHAHLAKDAKGAPLGIVHCDVSPSNVFVSRTGEIKLGDFGVSRAAGGPTIEGGTFGKLGYISPEQLRGDPVSPASDIYAVGLLSYELLTGEKAFPSDDPKQMLKLMKKPPAPLSSHRSDIPPAIEAAVLATLEPKPEKRTPTAAAFSEQLRGSFDDRVGTPMAIAALVRGLFEPSAARAPGPRVRPTTMVSLAVVRPSTVGIAVWRPSPPPPPKEAVAAPTSMMEPLAPLLGRLHSSLGSAAVQAEAGDVVRRLFVQDGCLVDAKSTAPAEQLGALLLTQADLAPEQLAWLTAKLQDGDPNLEALLVGERILDSAEVLEWREKLAANILRAALVESAQGAMGPLGPGHPAGRKRLGAQVVDAFRDGAVPARLDAGLELMPPDAAALAELGLLPSEVRRVQKVASSSAPAREHAAPEIRALLAAIVALGLA